MKMILLGKARLALAALALAGLAACGAPNVALESASVARNLPGTDGLEGVTPQAVLPKFRVARIDVTVPRELEVSEANRYYPGGDIVWREDPYGDRHEQVRQIVADGLMMGVQELEGAQPVILGVVVKRFHAVTEKARYTIGGVHAIQFELTVFDAETGEMLRPTELIRADFDALGGRAAIEAERQGITQKVRIKDQLARVIRDELTKEGGYVAEDLGILGAINQL